MSVDANPLSTTRPRAASAEFHGDGASDALTRYARTRDARLRARLIEAFLPLADALARRYGGTGAARDEAIRVANRGLVKAIDGFDPGAGRTFHALAVPTIIAELRLQVRLEQVKLPRRAQRPAESSYGGWEPNAT